MRLRVGDELRSIIAHEVAHLADRYGVALGHCADSSEHLPSLQGHFRGGLLGVFWVFAVIDSHIYGTVF